MSYAAAFGSGDSVSKNRLVEREAHPLGVRRYDDAEDYDPADDSVADAPPNRKWTFGVAAGTLLVAGTFAAGALGLNGSSLPVADEHAPEHAPSAPGHGADRGPGGPGDIGTPAVAAPPHGDRGHGSAADRNDSRTSPAAAGGDSQRGAGGEHAVPAAPAPARPAPPAAPAPAPKPGPVEKVVKPVTDTVGNVTRPVTDTVGGLVSPVTGALSGGGGDQPAMTMINPLGDLLGS